MAARFGHDEARLYRGGVAAPVVAAARKPLPAKFFARDVLTVARALLGQRLVRRCGEAPGAPLLCARIVEVEAYGGRCDRASHGHRGMTPRCATMFGPVGRLYVYFTYGSHFCANVVVGRRDERGENGDAGCAVLLRAARIEPSVRNGADQPSLAFARAARAERCRSVERRRDLLAGALDPVLLTGPGNLAAALALDRRHDGLDLTDGRGPLWIAAGERVRRVEWTPRIGLGDYPAASWCWRAVACDDDSDRRAATAISAGRPRSPRPRPGFGAAQRSPDTA